ncbi:MAG: hypothetical protein IJT88_04950 [Kiritimatiellae bacterium]|nr:hypothetical protein [Kiritimatiellia bacterium]
MMTAKRANARHVLEVLAVVKLFTVSSLGAGWTGETAAFRVDGRAGNGAALDAKAAEWAVWDAAWTEGTAQVEATLERPDGTVETLGGGEGGGARGSAEWMPGEDEWGTFTLRLASWDADGVPLGELLALRVRPMPAERAYAEWVAARGGTVESLPMEEDTDGDGANNWDEYVADTDPLDEGEVFESRVEVAEDGKVRVVPSVVSTGRVYGVKMWQDLTEEPEFRDLGYGHEGIGVDMNGDGETMGFGTMSVSVP